MADIANITGTANKKFIFHRVVQVDRQQFFIGKGLFCAGHIAV